MKIVDNGSNSPYNVPHQLEETTMLNIKEFAKEIEQFIEVSGDDVSSVVEVDEDNLLEFQHLSFMQRWKNRTVNKQPCKFYQGELS